MARPKSPYYDLMYQDGHDTKEYRAYCGMIQRCKRKTGSYAEISVDEYFLDKQEGFKRFYDDVGPCPDPELQLDRKENSLGYLKGNLKWSSRNDNLINRTVTLMIEKSDGNVIPLRQYCDEHGASYHRLRQKYNDGVRVRKAMEII